MLDSGITQFLLESELKSRKSSCWNWNQNQTFDFSWNRNQYIPGIVHHALFLSLTEIEKKKDQKKTLHGITFNLITAS